jgi:hypothetical protein
MAKRDGEHLTSAGTAKIGNAVNANLGGIWNGDHRYATIGFETNMNNGARRPALAAPEISNQQSWILFRQFAE